MTETEQQIFFKNKNYCIMTVLKYTEKQKEYHKDLYTLPSRFNTCKHFAFSVNLDIGCICAVLVTMSNSLATLGTVAHQAPRSLGILQTRILPWVAISFSRSSQTRDGTCISHIAGRFFSTEPPGKPNLDIYFLYKFILYHCLYL